jgi:uncharacterized protein (DUF1499 family)
MRSARALAMAVAVAGLAMLLASGPGTRLGLWPWQAGLSLLKWATYTAMAAGVAGLVLLAMHLTPRWRPLGPALPAAVVAIAVATMAMPLWMLSVARKVPPIHDITTDTEQPPPFVALLGERRASPNGADYGGPAVAAQQKQGYPGIEPLRVPQAPAAALERAAQAARGLGWQIAAADPAEGRLEATATTAWMGFKDDIVVRIRPDGSGSRIDVRSVSRVGRSDVGANAKRIREFLAKLA